MDGTAQRSASLLTPSNPGSPNWRAVATADLNRDGMTDILFQNTDGTLAVWHMNGLQLSQASLLNPSHPGDRAWQVVGAGDVGGDGKTDLLFQHTDGTLAMWVMDGTRLVSASLLSPATPGRGWRLAGTANVSRQKKVDLIFQHDNNDLAVWFMEGNKLSSAQLFNPKNSGGTWRVVAPR